MSAATAVAGGLVAVLLAVPWLAAGQEPAIRHHVLPNGMTVIVRENPTAGVMAAALHVRGGSREESAESAGVTNLLTRVMLRGTARRSASEVAEAAEALGGRLEAAGEADYAELRGAALARHGERLLSLLAEVALEPALDAAELERERRLVLGEIQTRADNPFPLALDTLQRHLYRGHPYAVPSIGLETSVERLTREALVARYREIYRPQRMVLAVSGRVAADRVVRLADRLFGNMARDAAVAPAAAGRASGRQETAWRGRVRPERHVVEKRAQQAQVLVGFVAAGIADADYAALKVLSAVLGGGMSGRLFVELREKRALAYAVGVANPSRAGPAYFVAYIGTEPRNAEVAEAGLRREVERVSADEVSEAELARAKAYLLGTLAMDRRTNARQAWYLAFFESMGAGWDFPDRYAREVERITVADVKRVAERYLAVPTVVVLTPPAAG
ncbi:MAG: M16 family metallopeptidase [Candidatus Rokuibacteriota bacterium]